jgi:hypothetical protein
MENIYKFFKKVSKLATDRSIKIKNSVEAKSKFFYNSCDKGIKYYVLEAYGVRVHLRHFIDKVIVVNIKLLIYYGLLFK